MEHDTNDANAYSNRAAAHLMFDASDRALADVDAAIGLNPNDAALYCNRAYVHFKMREYAKAVADTETILLSSGQAFAYNNRGYVLELMGERDTAIADYRKALELAPGLAISLKNLRRLGVE